MKTYLVTMPIAGHIVFEIEAENEEAAKEIAWSADPESGEVTWEILDSFGRGNVCHCPSPWEIDIELIDDGEEEEEGL